MSDAANGTEETFTRTFTVVGTPKDSTLEMAADNQYQVYVNGDLLVTDLDELNYGATVEYEIPAAMLQGGANTITFVITNIDHATENTPETNPAGLLYKITVNNDECDPYEPSEPETSTVTMCKAEFDENLENEGSYPSLPGWTLMLLGEDVESLSVPSTNSSGVNTVAALDDDTSYVALASGTWNNQGGANVVDAEYSTTNGWTTQMDGYTGYQTDILELQIDEAFDADGNNWGPYSSTHQYARSFMPDTDGAVNFRIFDGSGTTQNEGWFGDNSGSLNVDLSEGYAGVTGQNGCVTFTNVPQGTYTVAEVNQPGWSFHGLYGANDQQIEGLQVVVNESSETFTILNSFDDPENPNAGQDKVHIYKYLKNGETTAQLADNSGAPSFPMVSTWQADNLSGGATSSGSYVLGNNEGGTALKYAADTSAMDNGSYYTTSEVTDGSVVLPIGGTCEAGKYRLVGYKSGTSLVAAEAATVSATAPEFYDITTDRYVIVVNEACGTDGGPGDNDGTIEIVKHSLGGNGTFTFDLSEELTVSVVSADATITTEGGYGTTTLTVSPGTYDLTEYLQEGWTLQDVTCEYDGESEGSSIANGKTIYVGEDDTVTCTFTNTKNGQETTTLNTTVVSGNTTNTENTLGWMFNRDTSTETPYMFNTTAASIGSGSLFVPAITNTVDGNSDKFVGELFLLTPMADLNSVLWDFQIAAPDATVEEQFYMNVYANFGESSPTKFYDCRYNVVASVGSTGSFTTVTFDPTQAYPVTTRTSGQASPYTCPAVPADMDTVSASPNPSVVRVIALNLGDSSASDSGVSGYFDKVITSITTGSNTHVETYDFEAEGVTPQDNDDNGGDNNDNDGNSTGGRVRSASTGGQVLGATTECSALLSEFIGKSYANTSGEVSKLQNFLNTEMGSALPITGVFGPMTEAAVRTFQIKYWEDVLKPWFSFPEYGVLDSDDSTGIVYKTTKWKINDIFCPGSEVLPTLP